MFDDDGQHRGACHHRVHHHVLPGIDGFAVHGLDDVAFVNAEFGLRRARFDVTDDGRIHGHRQADKINDRGNGEGEDHVHEWPGNGHENFVKWRRGRHRQVSLQYAFVVGFSFQSFRGDHLWQLHETAGGNPAQRVFDAIALPTVNLGAKADGKFLDLHAQPSRDPKMAEFVDENGRAEQHEHGRNNINDG